MKILTSVFLSLIFLCVGKFSKTIPPGFVPYKTNGFSETQFQEARKKQEQGVTDFGRALLLSINAEKDTESIFISPLSINIALLMAATGSASETLLEVVNSLHLSNANSSESILRFQGTLTAGAKKESSAPLYTLANSVWISDRFEIYKSFVDSVKNAFDSKIEVADFSSQKTVEVINSWIFKETNGLIKKVISDIKRDDEIFLINTVYFNKKWAQPFKASLSKEANFTLLSGSTRPAVLMHASERCAYYSDEGVQAVLLRFEDRRASMLIVLPKLRGNEALVKAADKHLSHVGVANIMRNARGTKLNLALPRFKLSFSLSVKNSLKTVGINKAFENSAQFPYVSKEPLKVSDVIHQAVLRVDENGVEAAAATVVKVSRLMGMVDHEMPIPFVVNRPFVCALLDNAMTFFTGIIRDVDENGGSSSKRDF